MVMSVMNARYTTSENSRCTRPFAPDQSSTSELLYWIDSVRVNGQSYVKEHRVAGEIIYPAAAFSIAGTAVYQALRGSGSKQRSIALKDLKFSRALLLSPRDSTVLHLSYNPVQDRFAVHSQPVDESSALTLHASGSLAPANTHVPVSQTEIGELLARCRETFDVADFYRRLRRSGLDYGPYFQGIHSLQVSRSTNEVVARLIAHPDLSAERDPWARSVTLLDSAFQSLAATLSVDGSELYVPMRIKALHVYGDLHSDLWCYARQVNSNSRTVTGDISLFEPSGRNIAEIRGLQCLRKPGMHVTDVNKSVNKRGEKASNRNYCFQ